MTHNDKLDTKVKMMIAIEDAILPILREKICIKCSDEMQKFCNNTGYCLDNVGPFMDEIMFFVTNKIMPLLENKEN